VNCLHCGAAVPAGSRRDRVYCGNNCSALASYYRRKSGAAPPPRWQHPAVGSADPALRAAATRTRQLAEAHGWSPSTIRCALDGLMVLLDGRPAGERVTLTEIRTRTPRHTSAPRVAEVLAGLGLLEDDITPAIRSWIERRAGELPRGFAAAVRAWLLVLLDGDTRTRPRSHASIYVYLAAVRPLIDRWAADCGHLREVTAADIKTVLEPLRGHQFRTTTVAVRSLFRFARKRGLVFTNPAARLKAGNPCGSLLPMTDAEIRAVEQAATSPAQRLMVALAAVHAAGWAAIRDLTLDDLDLPNRRITIAGHHQRLGELTYRALRAWLGHRRATWPRTPNRHVLISGKTALGSGHVTRSYLNWNLQRHGVSIERIRRDRVLHEALTARADPLHLALVFGLSHTTASRYMLIACDLLADQPAEVAGESSTTLPIAAGHEDRPPDGLGRWHGG
jgi:site-specific recombinase XerD